MSGLLARQRFFFNLALPAASFLLIVASVAFGRGGAKGAGLAIGIAECAGSLLFAAALVRQPRPQRPAYGLTSPGGGRHDRRQEGGERVRIGRHVPCPPRTQRLPTITGR